MTRRRDPSRPLVGFSVRECPVCGHGKSVVYDSREDYGRLMRRRRCARCDRRWDTVEVPIALWTGFAEATAQMEAARAAMGGMMTAITDLAKLMRTVTDMATQDPDETRSPSPSRWQAADNSPSPPPRTARQDQTPLPVRDPLLNRLRAQRQLAEQREKRPPPDQTPGQ